MCVGRLKSGTGRLENHDVPASVYHSGSCGAAETPLFFRNKGAVKKLTAPFFMQQKRFGGAFCNILFLPRTGHPESITVLMIMWYNISKRDQRKKKSKEKSYMTGRLTTMIYYTDRD